MILYLLAAIGLFQLLLVVGCMTWFFGSAVREGIQQAKVERQLQAGPPVEEWAREMGFHD